MKTNMKVSDFKEMIEPASTSMECNKLDFELNNAINAEDSIGIFNDILAVFYSINVDEETEETNVIKDAFVNGQILDVYIDYYMLKFWTNIKLPQKKSDGNFVDDVMYIVNKSRKAGLTDKIYGCDPKITMWAKKMREDIYKAFDQLVNTEEKTGILAVLELNTEKLEEEVKMIVSQRKVMEAIADTNLTDLEGVNSQIEELNKLQNFDMVKEVVKDKNKKG